MIVDDIQSLRLVCVLQRGVPNQESIAIRVLEDVDLGQFGVMVGVSLPTGGANPIRDALYWFGDGLVNAGDWIFIYTGGGEPRINDDPLDGTKTYTLHWGRAATMFANSAVVPILFKMDAVQLGVSVQDKLQVAGKTDLHSISSSQLRISSDS